MTDDVPSRGMDSVVIDAISNGKHKIVFSFIIPPLSATINLVYEAKNYSIISEKK
jgi:hypothetical protein